MAFELQNSQVFFRDKFVPFDQANVSIASSSVLYGLCVYTVFGVSCNTQEDALYAFRLRDHYKRLVNSAKIMDFHSFANDWPYERFEATIKDLLSKNQIKEDVLVRASIFVDEIMAGTRIHDLKQSFSAYVCPMKQVLEPSGVNVCVSSWQRTADNAIPSRAKVNGSYANSSLMKNEALLNGYDEAIALDQHGHVSEGSVENLFIVRDGVLITPDPATDILEGITRDTVLRLANIQGIPVLERSIDRSELYIADEVFMCGSSVRVVPVLTIDKRPINHQKIGPITKQIDALFKTSQHTKTLDYPAWLTKI
jgi:branched-chain amino acid aminotransferase